MRTRFVAVLLAGVASLFACVSARAQVDAGKSYFVPQTMTASGVVTEGLPAIASFRTCPNLDGTQVLRLNARIMVRLHNAADQPIASVAAADIYVRLSGGVGDSTVTNGPACPGTQYLFADAPTDGDGVTYITFLGAPGTNGVAVRDPSHKWGHYDADLPVFALGVQLQGRLTSSGINGEYKLAIKNVDIFGGTAHDPNAKSEISMREINSFVNTLGTRKDPLSFWRDFDNNGVVNATDLNFVKAHRNHNCGSPIVN